jgi:hypothetical protein
MTIDRILNPAPPPTANEVKAALAIVVAVTETIREAKEVPEGILYATLMSRLDLVGFQKMVAVVVGSGLVEKQGHLLRWVGPTLAN